MRIILASQSLLRGKALDVLGVPYEKIPSNVDETTVQDSNASTRAQRLAETKAVAVGERFPDAIIVAGDLFCVMNSVPYEKPSTIDDAKRMLKELSGNTFEIISGLAVYSHQQCALVSCAEHSRVRFRTLTDEEIEAYCRTYPVTKFAGAFDGDGMLRFAEYVEGNYNFIAGLPVNRLIEYLRLFGVRV